MDLKKRFKLKNKLQTIGNWLVFLAVPRIIVGVSLGIVYLIASSDLPDWFKWFLLR